MQRARESALPAALAAGGALAARLSYVAVLLVRGVQHSPCNSGGGAPTHDDGERGGGQPLRTGEERGGRYDRRERQDDDDERIDG